MTKDTLDSNNMNIVLKNTSASSTESKGLNDAEIALIDLDKDMNKLMISKQDRQLLLDFGAFIGLMYFIYHTLNFFILSYQESSFKAYMLLKIYDDEEV